MTIIHEYAYSQLNLSWQNHAVFHRAIPRLFSELQTKYLELKAHRSQNI